MPPVEPVYRTLATLPRGPVIEMPFFYPQVGLFQHTKYMLASTAHWMPMVNGYSDYIPPDFYEHVMLLAPFPSRDAFKILEPNGVRYAVFHMNGYNAENRNDVLTRLKEFEQYLRPLYVDECDAAVRDRGVSAVGAAAGAGEAPQTLATGVASAGRLAPRARRRRRRRTARTASAAPAPTSDSSTADSIGWPMRVK